MAAQTQFKQQCPSCEAMVPIKDTSLVGKKIDCPKCKYRFVVDDPGAIDDEPKSANVKSKPDSPKAKSGEGKSKAKKGDDSDDGKPRKKKPEKKGGSAMLIVGVVLGLVAVIGLIIGLVVLFGGGDDSSSASSGSGSSTGNQASSSGRGNMPSGPMGGAAPMGGGPMGAGATEGSGDQPAKPAVDAAQVVASNLLPNDSQVVYSINISKFLASSLGGAAFKSSSGFQPSMFAKGLGLPIDRMSRFLRAENLKNKWVFNVVQMFPSFTVKADALKATLGAQPGPKSPVKGHQYFLVAPNEVMDSLSSIDAASLFDVSTEPGKVNPIALAWHVYDEQTLVIAEVGQMEQFLTANRKPEHRTQIAEDQQDQGSGPMGPMGPMGGPGGKGPMGMGPMMGRPGGGPGSGGPMGPMGGAPGIPTGVGGVGFGGPPMGGGAPGIPTGVGGAGFGGPPMGGGAPGIPTGVGGAGFGGGPMGPGGPMGQAGGNQLYTDRATYLTVHPDLKRMLDKMEESQSRQPVIFSCAGRELELVSSKIVDSVRSITTLGALIPLPTIVAAGMGLHLFSEEHLTGVAAIELRHEQDARSLDETLQKTVLPKAATLLSKWMGTTFNVSASTGDEDRQGGFGRGGFGPMGGFGGFGGFGPGGPAGAGGTGPTLPGGGFGPGVPGGAGPAGPGGAGPGSNVPMIPGGFGGPMGPTRPGGFGPTGPGGFGPMGPGGFGPMGPGGFGGNTQAQPSKSNLRSRFLGKVVFITFEAEVNSETDQKIRDEIEQQVVRMKGSTDVAAMTRPRLHELAGTVLQLKKEKRTVRGTFPIADPSGSVFVTRSPSQRVGWMVELLPQLGKADIYAEIDPKQPWRADKNLHAGTAWIPQFLNPTYPRSSWQARLPSAPHHALGATHYTGLAGVGLDSATWADDPAHRNKLGLFGYDRPTDFNDIPDGASNTIFLISTAPGYPRPWIAGGGATVQGVPEKNSLAPFVTDHGGKRGAYVLMADGSVRFLNANTPDNVFQALVTKAGSDDTGVLDAVAPKVQGSSEPLTKPKPTPPPATTTTATNNGGGIEWKEFVSKEGRYSVLAPEGTTRDLKQDVALPTGGSISAFIHQIDAGSKGNYSVTYADYPDAISQAPVEQVLNGAKAGISQTFPGAKIAGEKKITVNGSSGLEMTIGRDNESGLVRIILVKQRIYTIVAGGKGKIAESADARQFVESFKPTN